MPFIDFRKDIDYVTRRTNKKNPHIARTDTTVIRLKARI